MRIPNTGFIVRDYSRNTDKKKDKTAAVGFIPLYIIMRDESRRYIIPFSQRGREGWRGIFFPAKKDAIVRYFEL
jgi:hypothetical protein